VIRLLAFCSLHRLFPILILGITLNSFEFPHLGETLVVPPADFFTSNGALSAHIAVTHTDRGALLRTLGPRQNSNLPSCFWPSSAHPRPNSLFRLAFPRIGLYTVMALL
jgi:hypothetical protein